MSTDKSIWQSIMDRLLELLDDESAFKNWFGQTEFVSLQNGVLTIRVPSQFFKDWLTDHYLDEIKKAAEAAGQHCTEVVFEIDGKLAKQPEQQPANEQTQESAARPNPKKQAKREPATFEDFVEGAGNRLALAAAREVAFAQTCPYPMVALCGDPGVGKTHLLEAIAHAIRLENQANTGNCRQFLFTSAEAFTNEFMISLREKKSDAFRARWRRVDVLLVDEVQFLAGKEATQEEFFHTLNAIERHKGIVAITCDQSPDKVSGLEERIRSRLMQGLVIDINPPSRETLLAIARELASKSGFRFDPEALELVADCVSPDVRRVQGAMHKLALCARLDGGVVTLELARQALRGLVNLKGSKLVTIDLVIEAVARYSGLTVGDLRSRRRDQRVATPRQWAMYLCHQLIPSATLANIGQKFGRDHTTVLYACRGVERRYLSGRSLPGTNPIEELPGTNPIEELRQIILSD
ncbi:MAG: chromosomal replication initiator protein DnaA [Patescibacteria group bacterium]